MPDILRVACFRVALEGLDLISEVHLDARRAVRWVGLLGLADARIGTIVAQVQVCRFPGGDLSQEESYREELQKRGQCFILR